MPVSVTYDDVLLQAADAAYATYYPQTDPEFTGKARAWRGDPDKNPLLRPLEAALGVLVESAVRRMRAWAEAHGEADTQGLMPDEWESLARAALGLEPLDG